MSACVVRLYSVEHIVVISGDAFVVVWDSGGRVVFNIMCSGLLIMPEIN